MSPTDSTRTPAGISLCERIERLGSALSTICLKKKRAEELVTAAAGESDEPTAREMRSRISRILCGARFRWLACSVYSMDDSIDCSIFGSMKKAGSSALVFRKGLTTPRRIDWRTYSVSSTGFFDIEAASP